MTGTGQELMKKNATTANNNNSCVTSNPLRSDPQLKAMLEESNNGRIESIQEFDTWKVKFLNRLETFVDQQGIVNAQKVYEKIEKDTMVQLVTATFDLQKCIDEGKICSSSSSSVKGRNALNEIKRATTQATEQITQLLPTMRSDEEKMGYNKFHFSYVLVRDCFSIYMNMSVCRDMLNQAVNETLCLGQGGVADRQTLDAIEYYNRQIQRFCNILDDSLCLFDTMMCVYELRVSEWQKDGSSDKQALLLLSPSPRRNTPPPRAQSLQQQTPVQNDGEVSVLLSPSKRETPISRAQSLKSSSRIKKAPVKTQSDEQAKDVPALSPSKREAPLSRAHSLKSPSRNKKSPASTTQSDVLLQKEEPVTSTSKRETPSRAQSLKSPRSNKTPTKTKSDDQVKDVPALLSPSKREAPGRAQSLKSPRSKKTPDETTLTEQLQVPVTPSKSLALQKKEESLLSPSKRKALGRASSLKSPRSNNNTTPAGTTTQSDEQEAEQALSPSKRKALGRTQSLKSPRSSNKKPTSDEQKRVTSNSLVQEAEQALSPSKRKALGRAQSLKSLRFNNKALAGTTTQSDGQTSATPNSQVVQEAEQALLPSKRKALDRAQSLKSPCSNNNTPAGTTQTDDDHDHGKQPQQPTSVGDKSPQRKAPTCIQPQQQQQSLEQSTPKKTPARTQSLEQQSQQPPPSPRRTQSDDIETMRLVSPKKKKPTTTAAPVTPKQVSPQKNRLTNSTAASPRKKKLESPEKKKNSHKQPPQQPASKTQLPLVVELATPKREKRPTIAASAWPDQEKGLPPALLPPTPHQDEQPTASVTSKVQTVPPSSPKREREALASNIKKEATHSPHTTESESLFAPISPSPTTPMREVLPLPKPVSPDILDMYRVLSSSSGSPRLSPTHQKESTRLPNQQLHHAAQPPAPLVTPKKESVTESNQPQDQAQASPPLPVTPEKGGLIDSRVMRTPSRRYRSRHGGSPTKVRPQDPPRSQSPPELPLTRDSNADKQPTFVETNETQSHATPPPPRPSSPKRNKNVEGESSRSSLYIDSTLLIEPQSPTSSKQLHSQPPSKRNKDSSAATKLVQERPQSLKRELSKSRQKAPPAVPLSPKQKSVDTAGLLEQLQTAQPPPSDDSSTRRTRLSPPPLQSHDEEKKQKADELQDPQLSSQSPTPLPERSSSSGGKAARQLSMETVKTDNCRHGRKKKAGGGVNAGACNSRRPDIRVRVGSSALDVYNRNLRHDDCVLVPELFGPEDDFSMYHKIFVDLNGLQKMNNVEGTEEWTCSSDGGEHLTCTNPGRSPAFREIIRKVVKYFGMKKSTIQFKLDWYRDDSDTRPPCQFPQSFEQDIADALNITVVASFGAEREIALEKVVTNVDEHNAESASAIAVIHVPQTNNGVYSIGRNVNVRFMHSSIKGDNNNPETTTNQNGGANGRGRLSVTLWGHTDNALEE